MKKRILSLLLCVAMLLTLLPQTVLFASADDSGTCGENLEWSFDEATGTLTITGSGAMDDWPDSTAAPWYPYSSSIKYVSLSKGLTSIGEGAFDSYTGLTAISIPDSVTSIGDDAFSCCTGLTAISIPDSVTSIGDRAFICTGLKSITIPDSVKSIGDMAFYFCSSLTSIEIGDGVTSIGGYAFISTAFFNNSENWTNDALFINNYLIAVKSSLSGEYEIPEGTKLLANSVFNSCYGLTGITIPDSLTSIGNDTFNYCFNLKSITIPDSVSNIGLGAFCNCSNLADITIGNGVTSIGYDAFSGTDFYNNEDNWTDDILFINNYLIAAKSSLSGEYEIPEGTKLLAGSAFEDCTGLTSITIPDSVTSIGEYAFYHCTGLTSITLPDSVTSIGADAFYGCTGLTAISIPDSVTSIGVSAFSGCTGLTSITIPDSVTAISDGAFSGCTGLSHVHFLGSKPSIGAYAFSSCASDLTLCYLPETTGWENYTDYPAEEWDCTVTADCTSITYTCNTCGEAYTVIGEYHDWSLTETITAPTCTEAGSGVYTCAVCGRTKTEPILATGHSFVNGVCETCGEKLKIFSASLRLDENLNLVYAVQLPENIEDPHMVFTFLGTEITVTDYTVNADGRYCFELADINPQCMGDTISATLYATYDGTEYTDTIAEYSVRDYCVNMLAKTNDDLFVTLLSDLLTYGAAAQTYADYKTDALVTDGLDLTPSTFTALSGLTEEFAGTADPDTFWKSASLTLRNNVDMNLFFCTDSIEGLSVVLEINGRTETVTDFTPVDGEENLYQITFHGILATEFDLPVLASFYRDGAQVGNTLSYSVNTYICSKQHDGDAALAAMVQALYNYGATANTYYFERYLVQ